MVLQDPDGCRGKWQTKPSQTWLIPSKTLPGKSHRIGCGDSTDVLRVREFLQGAQPRLMATDPPYGVGYDSTWRAAFSSAGYVSGNMANDHRVDWRDVWELWQAPIAYVWHAGVHAAAVAESLLAARYQIRAQIIWRKPAHVFSRGHYHWQHEPCWYAVRRGCTANWRGDRKQKTVWDVGNRSSCGQTGDAADNFRGGHVAQKPVELFRRPIQNHTSRGDVVVEPFSGSGSQLVAAEQLGRICLAMEIEPKYVAVALERMAALGCEPRLED